VRRNLYSKCIYGVALLCVGGAMPVAGWTHSEGVEAADPATPAAVLTLASAARRYTAPDAPTVKWSARTNAAGESTSAPAGPTRGSQGNAHRHDAGHASTAPATQATREQ